MELAKKMGATVTINSREKVLKEEVMKLTDGNGIARLVEASGFPPVVNSCFSMLRKVRNNMLRRGLLSFTLLVRFSDDLKRIVIPKF